MHSRKLLKLCAWATTVAWGVDAESTWIRPDATGAANFRGWYIKGLTTSPKFCGAGRTRTTSGGYAGCCTAAPCPLPTDCRSDTLTFDGGSTSSCNAGATCWTMSVYATPPADGAYDRDVWCAGVNTETELFLSIPATSTGTSTGRGTSTATSTATNTSAAANPGSDTGSSSKAWIAGVVIGPLAGIALGVLVFFMLRRRWKKKHGAAAAAAGAGPVEARDGAGPAGYGMQEDWSKTRIPSEYSHQQWQASPQPPPSELDTSRFAGPPREMDARNATASELDAGYVERR